jgi:predicted N-acetyltransferase YhbS
MLEGRLLNRDEVGSVWTIDRREVIAAIYSSEDGKLALHPEYYDMHGWPLGESELYNPLLLECFDRGGWFYGLFEDGLLVAVAILESKTIGERHDLLQLKFLHVSCACRDRGLGRQLFDLAREEACRRGARGMYVSATPSQHTIDFYLRCGCHLAPEPDPDLYALEPEDIHLECYFSENQT